MHRIEFKKVAIASLVGIVTGGFLLASPAAAGKDGTKECDRGSTINCDAIAWFEANGDTFWVQDATKDGYSAVVNYRKKGSTGPWNFHYNDGGAGATEGAEWDLPEGTRVEYRACLGKNKVVLAETCGNVNANGIA
jgi:hypothetical protein